MEPRIPAYQAGSGDALKTASCGDDSRLRPMTFWMFTPWPPGWLNAGYFLGRYSFLNSEEMLRARPCPGEFARDGLPLARMRFDAEGVDDDCLPLGVWTLASDKMRRAMSFGLPEIQYFDVDTIQFSTSPSAKLQDHARFSDGDVRPGSFGIHVPEVRRWEHRTDGPYRCGLPT